MSKITKITLILIVVLSLLTSFVYATGINMNITNDDISSTSSTTQTSSGNNEYTRVTSLGQNSSNEGLSFSNILDIFLIVIGIVLILLAIAILIRLHG